MEESTNVIIASEDRDFIKKARMAYEKLKNKTEDIRTSYQENIVDTGISSDIEKIIDKRTKVIKTGIKIAGAIATVALVICPADGPVGEISTILATPALCKLVEVAADVQKKLLISGKRGIEKHILHSEGGKDETIEGYNLTTGEYVKDAVSIINGAKEFSRSI